jgi:hypothetical protein
MSSAEWDKIADDTAAVSKAGFKSTGDLLRAYQELVISTRTVKSVQNIAAAPLPPKEQP